MLMQRRIDAASVVGVGLSRADIVRRCVGAFRKRVVPDPEQWLPKNVRFPKTWESSAFDFDVAPHVRGFLRRFWKDPSKRKAVVIWASRLMKTSSMISIMEFVAACDPAPMGILFPDRQYLNQTIVEHIYPMLERCRPLRDQLLPKHLRNMKSIVLSECRIRLANAGTLSDASGWPARYIFKFEHDKCPTTGLREADASLRIESRTTGYARGVKIVEESTPGNAKDSRAAKSLKSAMVQQVRYQVPCPHCGEYQQLHFERLAMPKDEAGEVIPSRVAETVYLCEHCEQAIEDHHRPAMMRAGQWVIEGEWVDASGNICGEPKVQSDTMVFGELSFLYSLLISGWSRIAREYCEAVEAEKNGNDEPMKKFVTEGLAKPWEEKSEVVVVSELAQHLRGQHNRGQCPTDTAFLITTSDVGFVHDEPIFHWQTMAWARGCQGAVVDWGLIVGVPSWLEWCSRTRFEVRGKGIWLPVADFWIGLDTGSKYANEVYAIVDMTPNGLAIKGDSKTGAASGIDLCYATSRKAGLPTQLIAMKKKLGIDDLIMINSEATQRYREAVVNRRLKAGYAGYVTLPADVCDDWEANESYFAQLSADYRDGSRWSRSGANEAGDNLRYGRALAQRYTKNGLHWQQVTLPQKYLGLPHDAPRQSRNAQKSAGGLSAQRFGQSYLISNRK